MINQFIGFGLNAYIHNSPEVTRDNAVKFLGELYDEVNAHLKRNRVLQ